MILILIALMKSLIDDFSFFSCLNIFMKNDRKTANKLKKYISKSSFERHWQNESLFSYIKI